jgi:hypothetical protein
MPSPHAILMTELLPTSPVRILALNDLRIVNDSSGQNNHKLSFQILSANTDMSLAKKFFNKILKNISKKNALPTVSI